MTLIHLQIQQAIAAIGMVILGGILYTVTQGAQWVTKGQFA